MKLRHVILLMVGSILITGGSFGFGYYVSQQNIKSEEADTSEVVDKEDSSSSNSQTGLKVKSSGDDLLANSIPEPENFDVYEQFASEQSTVFQDLEIGEGTEVGAGYEVAIIYQGWLTDGTLFDQSKINDAGDTQPFVFTVGAGEVVPGMEQGVTGMKVGGKRRLIIPPSVGYGEQGQGSIPPNSVLIFDVELVQGQQQQPEPEPTPSDTGL